MKTILWFTYFWLYQLFMYPKIWKVRRLLKNGDIAQHDALVQKYVSAWAKALLRTAGVTVNITGKENIPKEPVVYVANHQGNFDIPVLLSCLDKPNSLVAKEELSHLPLVSLWMKELNCNYVSRNNPRKSMEAVLNSIKLVKKGYSVIIFPEGRRSLGDNLNEFKPGATKIAIKSKAPIVPVVIDGTYKILEGNNNKIKATTINITILPPIQTKDMANDDIETIDTYLHDLIQSEKEKLTKK